MMSIVKSNDTKFVHRNVTGLAHSLHREGHCNFGTTSEVDLLHAVRSYAHNLFSNNVGKFIWRKCVSINFVRHKLVIQFRVASMNEVIMVVSKDLSRC